MTHPEELLAAYVDGTLSAKDQASVDAHLTECARCSRETTLAARARSALRSMAEEPAPAGLASRALKEAVGDGRSSTTGEGTPRWYRIGGVVGAVAAGLLVFTLVLPHIGQSQDDGAGGAALGKADAPAADSREATTLQASQMEIRHVNYDNATLTEFTTSYTSDAGGGGGVGAAQASPTPVYATQAQTDKAVACIAQSAPDESGVLQSLIRARFQNTPAYFAVFTEGPGAGQPADAVTVWVLAVTDCGILSFSSAQL